MKILAWIVGIVVLVAVGVVAYVFINSGNLVKAGIEEFGPGYLGVDVQVREVNLDLADGAAQVKGLNIGNPKGFPGSHLMKLGEVKVVLDTSQISETLVVMKHVLIDGADIAVIAKGKRTNFQQLIDNLDSAVGESGDSAADNTGAEMKFIIDRFEFTDARASLNSDLLGQLDLQIPDIRLQNVGRNTNGATAVELAQQLFKPISAAISKAAVSEGLDLEGVKQNVEQKIRDKVSSGLRGLLKK